MKIAVVGCGAMGSIYAGLLASAGNTVCVVDGWQAHVDAINAQGLRVEGASGDRRVRLAAHLQAPAQAMDLVIIAAKAAQVGAAAQAALPMLGSQTLVLTLQNGLGSDDQVAGVLGPERLIVGIAAVYAILRPNDTTVVAHWLGVSRGADLLTYGLVIAFIFTTISTYIRFKDLELCYARLARAVALQNARPPAEDPAA